MPEENENNEGTQNDDGGENNSGGENKGGEDGKTKLVSIPQEEFSRIMAREKQQGRDAAKKALLKELGVTDEAEIKRVLESHRESEDAKKTEAEREKERAVQEASEAKAEKVEARKERYAARVESALLGADVPSDVVSRAARLVEIEWDPATDAVPDAETIKGAVAELKKSMPDLFKKATKKGPKDSDVGNGGGGNSNVTTESRVNDRLARRHPQTVKKE